MKKNESTPLKEGRTKSTTKPYTEEGRKADPPKPLKTNNMKKYSKEEIQKGFEAWRKDAKENPECYDNSSELTDSDVLVTFMENNNHTYYKK